MLSHPILQPWLERERVTQEWRLSVLTAPLALPVTIAELQDQARILFPGEDDPCGGAEDDLLLRMLEAALAEIDSPFGWLGRSLITRQLRLTLDMTPPTVVRLPAPPVTSVDQVSFTDEAGVDVVILPGAFDTFGIKTDLADTGHPALLWIDQDFSWPSMREQPARLRIDYTAGYADADAVPSIIKHWILVKAAEKYRDREGSVIGTIVAILEHVERLLDNQRVRM